jgi:hypothetical protein
MVVRIFGIFDLTLYMVFALNDAARDANGNGFSGKS